MKKRDNINRNFAVVTTLSFCICLLFFSIVQFTFMDDIYLFVKQKSMINTADEIIEIDFESEAYEKLLSEHESGKNVYIEIYSPRDKLFYTTQSNKATTVTDETNKDKSENLEPRIMKIISHNELENGNYFEIRQETHSSSRFIVYGAFFGNNNGIELYHPIDVIKENANTASWAVFISSCIFSSLLLLIAVIYVKSITSPLMLINKTTKKIKNLDFSETCPTFRQRDLNELSTNINSLSFSLSSALNNLKSENLKLEKDIERERHMEKIMRSFSANISHELKTPISIIQGYAEGMKLGIGCDTTDEFCDIIIEESEKMNNLICRLMEYLQFGSETYRINQSTFNISEFVNDCIKMHMHRIDAVGAKITTDIDENIFGYGDSELLTNVLNNYISNALSHIDFEKEIVITVKEKNSVYTVSVFNTGKNIPGTDIENIWQSFYRADKSHSRAEGRFGLGLSIVAILQKLHNQKYGCINKENGVEFWFDIKKSEHI